MCKKGESTLELKNRKIKGSDQFHMLYTCTAVMVIVLLIPEANSQLRLPLVDDDCL